MKTEFRNGYHVNSLEAEKHPGLKCIGDFLVEHFGEAAQKIDGVSSWGGWTFSAARFTCSDDGHLQVICGGTCIITFHRSHTVDKRPFYLVIDDLDRAAAMLLHKAGGAALHQRTEPPRLRLVASA